MIFAIMVFEKTSVEQMYKLQMNEIYRNQGQMAAGINKVFYSYSLSIPAIYLCRHCIELSIKNAISHLGKDGKATHGLEGQWNAFRQYLPQNRISGKVYVGQYGNNNRGSCSMEKCRGEID